MTTDQKDQLKRIGLKLEEAARKDYQLKVFGAGSHRYKFHAPATKNDVREFENEFGITLPEDYVAFITTIGNGGPGHYGGAGPYYGVYELGDFGFMQINSHTMSMEPAIHSGITQEKWDELTEFSKGANEEENETAEHERKYNELFAGLMTLGTMGCNGQVMLVLNGPDKGRVVYIDQDLCLPTFAPEKGFLDWYEKWLDKVLT